MPLCIWMKRDSGVRRVRRGSRRRDAPLPDTNMRPAWQPVSVRLRRTSGFEGLFFELRANLGFMFSSEDVDRLIDSPPPDADAFIDAVLVAGGFSDPEMCDLHLRRQVRDTIREHIDFTGSR